MYGREKSAVVRPTKAVNATRKTLKESIKNCSSATSMLPCAMTRTVSALAPMKVAKLNRTLASAAQRRSPSTQRIAAPSRGGAPTSSRNSTSTILFQRLEILQIEVVQLFANLEEEHAQHQHRDQDIE